MNETSIVPAWLLELMKLWPLFMLMSALILGGILLYLKTRFVTHQRCSEHREGILAEQTKMKELEKRVDNIGGSLGILQNSLNQALQNMPTAKCMKDISLGLSALDGDMKALTAKLEGQDRALERVERSVNLLTGVHMGGTHP